MEPNSRRPLSRADERRLSRRIEHGDARAREEMIARNLGLVHSVALAYRGRGVALEDLVQEGTVGLMHAANPDDALSKVFALATPADVRAVWVAGALVTDKGVVTSEMRKSDTV